MIEHEGVFYLELEDALAIYAIIFECSSTQAADQLRSRSGLEGALARPITYADYYNADLALQAAILAHGIAEGQYFIEGNKRTAYFSCITFLDQNGYVLNIAQEEIALWIQELSEGLSPDDLAAHFRRVLTKS